MGIRKKISIAFLCLAIMLAFSGMVSMLELGRLSRYTKELLQSGSTNMSLSKRMLDAAQEANTSILQHIMLGEEAYSHAFAAARDRFMDALSEAEADGVDMPGVDSARRAWNKYDGLAGRLLEHASMDEVKLFLETYAGSYLELTSAVKNMIADSQQMLANDAIRIKAKAYRAITPGIISLGVAIVMLLIFAFLIDVYYTSPTVAISRSLRNYLNHKVPFEVKMEGRDEVRQLKDSVDELISMYKNKKNCQ